MKNRLALPFSWILFMAFLLNTFEVQGQKLNSRRINKIIKSSDLLKKHFVGLSIYDQENKAQVYEHQGAQNFIPASNTKILTLYASLEMLGDSIPALKYSIQNDSLFFWGTGDPTLGYANFKSQKVVDFLKNAKQQLFYIPNNYNDPFYGYGWNYDDYQEYYQVEKTAFPVDGNTVVLTSNANGELQINPPLLKKFFTAKPMHSKKEFRAERNLWSNDFSIPNHLQPPTKYYQEIPLKTSTALTLEVLEEKINRKITPVLKPFPKNFKIIYSEKTDDVLRQMMLPSDNFLAEQLLLVCASTLGDTLSTEAVIEHVKKNYLSDIAKEIQWVDGSGLSRFNLVSPNSFVSILQKINSKVNNEERLHSFFPAGGLNGTLKRAYGTANGKAFVWAKTGTLTNNYNQSGYLITKKGKKLIFSFMNNNFLPDASEIRKEMVKIMTEIHNKF